jgi:hypothetical protein
VPTREERKRELTALLCSHNGRIRLTELLRQCLNVPAGQPLTVGTPFVETILEHEFRAAAQP